MAENKRITSTVTGPEVDTYKLVATAQIILRELLRAQNYSVHDIISLTATSNVINPGRNDGLFTIRLNAYVRRVQ